MYKNVNSQYIAVFAYDKTTGNPVTGDDANISAYFFRDGAAVSVQGDGPPTEADATNLPGVYHWLLETVDTNFDFIAVLATSTTTNVVMDIVQIYTREKSTDDTVTLISDNLSTGLTNTLTHKENGTLTDTAAAPTITVTRDDNGVDVAGYPQAMTAVSTGVWNDTFTPPATGISYTVTITYTQTNGATRTVTSTVGSGVSAVSLNSFITVNEFFRYHDQNVIGRLSDDSGAGTIDTDVVTTILNSASAYIYSYIRGHYKNLTTTDFSSITDPYIKKLTAILATAYLYERRGGVLPETVADDKVRADFELDQIQKSKRQLTGGRTQKLTDKVYPLGEPDTEHTITEDFTDGQSGTDRAIKMP